MFVYERDKAICIAFDSDKPVEVPNYELVFDVEAGKMYVNGVEASAIKSEVLEEDSTDKVFKIDAPVAVNLNGHTISDRADTAGDGIYHVVKGGSLTINGEGTIDSVGNNAYSMAVWAEGGSVRINGGYFTNVGAKEMTNEDPEHFDLIYVKGGSVEINGGEFKCETPKWTLNLNDKVGGSIVVKGGRFYQYNPAESYTEPTEPAGLPVSFVAPGYKVIKDGDWYEVVRA